MGICYVNNELLIRYGLIKKDIDAIRQMLWDNAKCFSMNYELYTWIRCS